MNNFCSKCNQFKPRTSFYKDSTRKESVDSWCKDCRNKNNKLYINKDKIKIYNNQYYLNITKPKRSLTV